MGGEAILTNFVTEILKKLGSFGLEEINLSRSLKKEVEKLKKTILMFGAVISDAENKQVKDKSVEFWLKDLKDLAYEVDDILDKYAYDLMHQRQGLNRTRDKVRNFISISSNPIARSSKMGHEIKDLNQKFDELARQRVGLGLQTNGVGSSSHTTSVDGSYGINRETYAFVDESKVLGRDDDKSNIINMLLANKSSCNQNDKISVIPIVGMGGLGKTTLAQFVYKDTVVENHFDLRIWVCVSDVFDHKKIFLNITNSIPAANNIGAGSDLNFIVNQLQQHLGGKRFLLVLDDVWNDKDGEWNKLKDPLMVGAEGSKILVTTRSEKVASTVLAGEFSSYKLQSLGDGICLSIFEQRAFGPSCRAIRTPILVNIGKELVRKCGGLPLAAEALGSLMRSKKEVSEWEVIRDSEIWKSTPENPNEILPALKLSYDHLSSQVKQCFSYCSLFPKDWEIERKTLIHLWVAEGFIQPSKGRLLEEIGYEYFQILLWNSFFQGVRTNKYGEMMTFKMHDLIHDLAQSVVGTHECVVVTEAIEMRDISEFRRINLLNVNEESFTAALVLKSKLRSLYINYGLIKDFANYGRLFNSHRKLRVLDLSFTDIEELPPSIGDLKHLRYLDLSNCRYLKKLPEAITRLYNLQTLNLKGCRYLEKFPKDLNRLINLRHLVHDLSDWRQLKVGQLTCLQTLSRFGVPKDNEGGGGGMGMGELQCLNLLGGKLEITCLERVRGGRENAEKANLKAKKFMKQLNLRWGDEVEDVDDRRGEEEKYNNHSLVLEGLQPHHNLRTLKIYNFMGPKFPMWMSSNPSSCLPNLVYLKLSGCDRCKQLPALGVLPSLRSLRIDRMLLLEEWLDQPSSSSSSSSSYPSLESIKILESPKLKSMPTKIFSLKKFHVEKSSGIGVSSIVRSNLNTLTKLVVRVDYDGLEFLPLGLLKGNNVLINLFISYCHDFKGFKRGVVVEGDEDLLLPSSCSSLRKLDLYNCPVLRLLPGDLRDLTSLQSLSIRHCGESNDDHCKSLEMSDCPMLKSMPTLFPSMESLEFDSCDGKIVSSVLRSNLMDTLMDLGLSNIPGLMFLPLGLLKDNNVLQNLSISGCPDFQGFNRGVVVVEGDEDLLLSSCSSLQELVLEHCHVLRLHPGDLRDLTSLRSLFIIHCGESNDDHCKSIEMMSDCPMLKSMPTLFPSMRSLEFVCCDGKIVTSVLRSNLMDTLDHLWLSNIPGLMFLPLGLLKDNNVLWSLKIEDCPDFQGFIQEVEGDKDLSLSSSNSNRSKSSLQSLYLRNCPVLRLLPDLTDFTSLLDVTIQGCNEDLVISLPNGVENRL